MDNPADHLRELHREALAVAGRALSGNSGDAGRRRAPTRKYQGGAEGGSRLQGSQGTRAGRKKFWPIAVAPLVAAAILVLSRLETSGPMPTTSSTIGRENPTVSPRVRALSSKRPMQPASPNLMTGGGLGQPTAGGTIWEVEPGAGPPEGGRSSEAWPPRELVRGVQKKLNELGYDSGPEDGILGPKTRRAIRAFEQDAELPITGIFTPELAAAVERSANLTQGR